MKVKKGSFEIYSQDLTVFVNCVGTWNMSTLNDFSRFYKSYATKFNGQVWAFLIDLSSCEVPVHDIITGINDLFDFGASLNQKYIAVVCNNSIIKWFIQNAHNKNSGIEARFCLSISEAKEWFVTLGMLKEEGR